MPFARTLGVLGASGGVGASTLSAALAVRFASARGRALCLDAAPLGGGLDVVLGLDHEPGPRWGDVVRGGDVSTPLLRRLPAAAEVPVLSFGRGGLVAPTEDAWERVFSALRPEVDLVVVDLPPASDRALPELLSRLDDVVLLVGESLTALAAASSAFVALDPHVDRWWLAQRVSRGNEDLGQTVASALDVPLLVSWPHDPRVSTDLVKGVPPGGRGRAASCADAALEVLYGRRRRRSA